MIVKKFYTKYSRNKYCAYDCIGWFLFGFIPLYIIRGNRRFLAK